MAFIIENALFYECCMSFVLIIIFVLSSYCLVFLARAIEKSEYLQDVAINHCKDSISFCYKVSVENLGESVTQHELKEAFSSYGPVPVAINPPESTFVEFMHQRDAENAVRRLDGRFLHGCQIRVKFSNKKTGSSLRPSQYDILESSGAIQAHVRDKKSIRSKVNQDVGVNKFKNKKSSVIDPLGLRIQRLINNQRNHSSSSTSGDYREPFAQHNGNAAQQLQESDRPQQLQESGRPQQLQESGRPQQLQESVRTQQLQESVRAQQLQEIGRFQQLRRSGRPELFQRNGGPQQLVGSDRLQQLQENGKSQQLLGSGEPQQLKGSGRPEQLLGCGRPKQLLGNGRPKQLLGNGRPQQLQGSDRLTEQQNHRSQQQIRNSSQHQCNSFSGAPSHSSSVSNSNDASDEIKCVICYDTVDNCEMKYIPCGHSFHARCCNEWFLSHGACPICRTIVVPRIDTRLLTINNLLHECMNLIIRINERLNLHEHHRQNFVDIIDSMEDELHR